MDNRAHTLVHLLLSICIFSSKIHIANRARTLAIYPMAIYPPPRPQSCYNIPL